MRLRFFVPFFISLVSAFEPSGGGPCYNIDGSEDSQSSACYVLDSVGASMCCANGEDCRVDGLCTGSANGLTGPYDNGKAIWRRSCTDFAWQDPACVAIAPSAKPRLPNVKVLTFGGIMLLTLVCTSSKISAIGPAKQLLRCIVVPARSR